MKVAAVLLNFFIPGVGSLVIGKTGSGITQLLLYFFGWVFTATLIGAIIGIPMVIAAWIWGLVTAATFDEQTANPVQVHIVHSPTALIRPRRATRSDHSRTRPIIRRPVIRPS